MTSIGLIGTGLVGSNIIQSQYLSIPSENRFTRANIGNICQRTFDVLICAAPHGTKYIANQNPDTDGEIETLFRLHSGAWSEKVRTLVLLSTIDVYPDRVGDESTIDTCDQSRNHPYGRHRRELELFVKKHFPDNYLIVRLPGLFGPGLKKNVLYDLMHNHRLECINPASTFQYYDLRRLGHDLRSMLEGRYPFSHIPRPDHTASALRDISYLPALLARPPRNDPPRLNDDLTFLHKKKTEHISGQQLLSSPPLREINLVPPPIATSFINDRFFKRQIGKSPDPAVAYNVRTVYTPSGYTSSEGNIMNDLSGYLSHLSDKSS